MSEMESKAALWHRKEAFRAIWGNPDSLRPLGRSNTSQLLLLYTLSRVLANCPQRCWPVSVPTLAEREIAREISGKETLSSSLSHTCPLWRWLWKGLILVIISRVRFLLFHSNRSLKDLWEILFRLFILPAKIFRKNLMLWHDSRGIQFPGRDPAQGHVVSMLFCLPVPQDFLHCVLFDCNNGPHFIVRSRHSPRERCSP